LATWGGKLVSLGKISGSDKVTMGEKVKNKTLFNLVANTGDLAALPTTVVDLLYLFKEEDASAQSVVNILHRDPARTAHVLKMSNSAFFVEYSP
jgi:HD-like signal output (HDOD) protein